MYEIGRVYVWQNMVGASEHLNGTECMVESLPYRGINQLDGEIYAYQITNTIFQTTGRIMSARAGQLRPKKPPTGEQKIRSMFEPKPVMEVA